MLDEDEDEEVEDISGEDDSEAGDHEGVREDLEIDQLGYDTDGADLAESPPSMERRCSPRKLTSTRKVAISRPIVEQQQATSPTAVGVLHKHGVRATSGLPSRWRQLEVRCFFSDIGGTLAHYITTR